jgi:hypothetical protein
MRTEPVPSRGEGTYAAILLFPLYQFNFQQFIPLLIRGGFIITILDGEDTSSISPPLHCFMRSLLHATSNISTGFIAHAVP